MQDFESGLFTQIGDDIIADLARAGYFARLDDQLCPADTAPPLAPCEHSFAASIQVLRELPVDLYDIERILNFFRTHGAACDCEVLTLFAPASRFRTTRRSTWPQTAGD
ncbi:MAG TPA: DUF2695 domain-containing protein [Terracidiphilus sp.]